MVRARERGLPTLELDSVAERASDSQLERHGQNLLYLPGVPDLPGSVQARADDRKVEAEGEEEEAPRAQPALGNDGHLRPEERHQDGHQRWAPQENQQVTQKG